MPGRAGTVTNVTFTIELEREEDGRWIGEVFALPGVLCYALDRDEAVASVQALALQVIAECVENREGSSASTNIMFEVSKDDQACLLEP
jgi:predicted RNase H-like HicB family nuclease